MLDRNIQIVYTVYIQINKYMNTKEINKVLKTGKFTQGGSVSSSRVRGWGKTIEGFEVIPDIIETFSVKFRKVWSVKQSGVFAITYYSRNGKEESNKILTDMYNHLKANGVDATLDLDNSHIVRGRNRHTTGAKIIVGDVSVLDTDHYPVIHTNL